MPRPNLANPYNLEPRLKPHATDVPLWNSVLNRWTVFDAKKITLEIGNFMDYRSTEMVRGISVVVDLRLMTSPAGFPMQTTTTEVLVGTLSSDVTFGLLFSGFDRRLRLAYRRATDWSSAVGSTFILAPDQDRVFVINFTRSIIERQHFALTFSVYTTTTESNGNDAAIGKPIGFKFLLIGPTNFQSLRRYSNRLHEIPG